jgi:hypothetical protein
MQEDNVVKAYARSNFNLNKSIPVITQNVTNLTNNTEACHQYSKNYLEQSDALDYNPEECEAS